MLWPTELWESNNGFCLCLQRLQGGGIGYRHDTAIICGGNYDNNKGYFIEPTIAVATNPTFAIRGVLTS